MPRYKFLGPTAQSIPGLALDVEPGEVFDCPHEITNANFELVEAPVQPKEPEPEPVTPPPAAAAKSAAKEK